MAADALIRVFPDPCLRKTCQIVKHPERDSVQKLIRLMRQEIRRQKHGIGIAAPQIGSNLQIAIVDLSSRQANEKELILINPKIVVLEEAVLSREGCMSVPDYRGDIKRYSRVALIWHDDRGGIHKGQFEGLKAICIQHEVDHLQGMLFIDRVTSLKRDLIPRKLSR